MATLVIVEKVALHATVFEAITDITLLKYLKSLVTCHSLFKQTSKKENPSSCFTSAR